jgi:hypothetical protein
MMLFIAGILAAVGLGIGAIILLIVGISKGRAALWGTAIAIGAAAIVLGVFSLGYGLFYGASKASQAAMAMATQAAAGMHQAQTQQFRQWFDWTTGLDLPADVTCLEKEDVGGWDANADAWYARLAAPNGITGMLSDYQPADWPTAGSVLTPPMQHRGEVSYFWNARQLQGHQLYVRSYTDPRGTMFVSAIAWDPVAKEAWFAAERGATLPVTQPRLGPVRLHGGSSAGP